MRYLFALFLSITCLSSIAQFQITGLTPQTTPVVSEQCNGNISMSFSALTAPTSGSGVGQIVQIIQGTNFSGFQFTVTIDWGDGTTTTHNGGTSTSGTYIQTSPAANHYYPVPGSYSVVTTISGPGVSGAASSTVDIIIIPCLHVYTFVGVDCDGDGTNEQSISTPLPATVSNDNFLSSQNISLNTNGVTTIFGMQPGLIQIELDSLWLTANGYSMNANSSNEFYSPGNGIYTISIQLNCIDTPPCATSIVQSFMSNNAIVYSTTSNSSISNFQWTITPYDQNGQAMPSGVFSSQNAYLTNTFGVNYVEACLNATFNNGCVFDTCMTFQIASGVVCTGGYLFCDGNNNGLYESGEYVLSNAPITVNNLENGSFTTVTTNTTGYYNAYLQGFSGNSLTVSISPNYLANLGYTTNIPIIETTGIDCEFGGTQSLNNIPIQCGNFNPYPYLCYSGYVFCDANGNGIQNPGEAPIMGAPITLGWTTLNSANVTVYTDSSGYFHYCGSIYGVTSVAIASVSSSWLIDNGSTLPNNNNMFSIQGSLSSITQPLAIPVYCAGSATACSDLWTTVTPWIGYFQGQNATIRLNWGNYGPGATPYTLTLNWPVNVTLNTSSILNPNYVINGNSITWTINSTQTSFSTTDHLSFTLPTGLINGEQHLFTSTIASTEGTDCYEGNNTGGLLQILGNAYDPNDKTVYKKSFHESNGTAFQESTIDWFIDDELEYTIRFQNTGTAPAQNIFIIDTLDAELDWSTFKLLNTTHEMNVVNLGNGILRFEFNNIWLPDSSVSQDLSQGHLTFRIRENIGNELFSEITNTAYIFFDWNPAIITNTTYNINDWLEFVGEENAFNVEAYPNPMLNELTLKVEGPFNYEIHDLTGRKLMQGMGVGQTSISTEALASGTYLLSVYVNGAKQTAVLLKQ